MPTKGYTWTDEYRKKFYESEKVQAHLEVFVTQAKQPKPLEQREKMSVAKKDKPKSPAHRQHMSEAHKFRQALKKEIIEKNPNLTTNEVWDLVRERMPND